MKSALAAASVLFLGAAANARAAEMDVRFDRLRNQRGSLHLCLTRNPSFFPNCGKDPHAIKRSMSAAGEAVRLASIPPGSYALSVMHDENRNGRLDTLLGIPREGFGFSGNPVVRFGPPRFDQVRMEVPTGLTRVRVRMQYLL